MKNNISHFFTFKTDSTIIKDLEYENILYLSKEDGSKHFAQYLQYSANDNRSIDVRHISIKVDRSYFLEMANACINDRDRRRHFFSTLGKRRFGASNKHFDCYLSHRECDEKYLFQMYLNHYEGREFEPIYAETTKYSRNKYRIYIESTKGLHTVFLDQLNITSRKKIHKIFCIDITDDELNFYNELITPSQKVNYIFNKIGKSYFKNLKTINLKQNRNYQTSKELVLSILITDSNALEKSSQIQDNTSFRKLKNKNIDRPGVSTSLAQAALTLINTPNQESENMFMLRLKKFKINIEGISGLKDMLLELEVLSELMLAHSVSYLLSKNDHDLQDIFMYTLESFATWNAYLDEEENEDIKAFNRATIDVTDAIRHFVEICYKFKHEYKCNDSNELLQNQILLKEVPLQESKNELCTSAKNYFSDIDIDLEVYEELLELDREVGVIIYSQVYTQEINSILINFFHGYTRVLNPLFEFKDLSYSLILLTKKFSEYEIDENSEMLLILLKGLISDLLEWKRTVLIEQTAEDIHFMDKSFYSNIVQIEMSLECNDLDDDGDIEFFKTL